MSYKTKAEKRAFRSGIAVGCQKGSSNYHSNKKR